MEPEMSESVLIRIKKIKSKEILRDALKHILRQIPAETANKSPIDPTKTHLNSVLRGGTNPVQMAQSTIRTILEGTGKPLRKNGIVAVEVMFSLRLGSEIDDASFFDQTVQWLEGYWHCPVISAVVHRDEANTHMHVIILPLLGGKMVGASLVGHKIHLALFKRHHHEEVGQYFGLTHVESIPRFRRLVAAGQIIQTLVDQPSLLALPAVQSALLTCIAISPAELCAVLGIDVGSGK
jgi:hypothetical protein